MLNNKKRCEGIGPYTTYYYTVTDYIFCKKLFYYSQKIEKGNV